MKENEINDRLYEIKERLKVRPYSPILNALFLTYNFMLKNYDVVEMQSESLSMDFPTPSTLFELFRGIANLIKRKEAEANVAFKYVLSIDPENHYGYLFKGIINLKEGKSAKELFSKAIALAPKYEKEDLISITKENEDDRLKIILSEENISRKEFISILEELEKTTKNDPIIKTTLAEAYLRAGEFKNVVPLLENVLINYPNYPRALYLMGRIVEEYLGNHDKANEYFIKVVEVNPLCRFRTVAVEDERLFKNEELSELINIFRTERPILKFFENIYKETVTISEPPKAETLKIEENTASKVENKPLEEQKVGEKAAEIEDNSLEEGINLLREKKYEEALKFFLNKLKKPQNK